MLKTRSTLLALFALVAASGAAAAPPDPAPPRQASALDDEDRPKIRPAIHHVQPTDAQRDMAALRAEVQRLRANALMCQDIVAGKLAPDAAPPGR